MGIEDRQALRPNGVHHVPLDRVDGVRHPFPQWIGVERLERVAGTLSVEGDDGQDEDQTEQGKLLDQGATDPVPLPVSVPTEAPQRPEVEQQ